MTDYIREEIRVTTHLAHTLNRLAQQYRREGNTAEWRRKRKSALWYITAAKDLKLLAIGAEQ